MNLRDIYQKLRDENSEIDEYTLKQQAWILRDRMIYEKSLINNNITPSAGSSGGGILLNSVLNTRTNTRYVTIQLAIDNSLSGDTLIVSPGVYSESITIDKPINILGPNSEISGNSQKRKREAIIKTPLDSGVINYTGSQPTFYRKYSLFINTGINNVKISGFEFIGDLLFDLDNNNHVGSSAIGTGRNSLNDNIEITNNIILNYQQKYINFNSFTNNSAAIWLNGVRKFNIENNYINSNTIGINIFGPAFSNYVGTIPDDHVITIKNNKIKSLNSGFYLRQLYGDISLIDNDIEIIDRISDNYGIYLRAFHSHNLVNFLRGRTLIDKNSIYSTNGIYSEVGNSTNIEIIKNIIKTESNGIHILKTYNQNQYLRVVENQILYIESPTNWIGIYLANNTATPSFYGNSVEIKNNFINALHLNTGLTTIAIRIDGTSNPTETTITGNETTGYTVNNQMIYFRQSAAIAFNLETIKNNNIMVGSTISGNDIIGG